MPFGENVSAFKSGLHPVIPNSLVQQCIITNKVEHQLAVWNYTSATNQNHLFRSVKCSAMSAHDKDPEIRFVTAIYTYISYFVLIMVRFILNGDFMIVYSSYSPHNL